VKRVVEALRQRTTCGHRLRSVFNDTTLGILDVADIVLTV